MDSIEIMETISDKKEEIKKQFLNEIQKPITHITTKK